MWRRRPCSCRAGGADCVALVGADPAGFPGAWFFLILAPTSSVLPIVTEVAAEHRMYLPLAHPAHAQGDARGSRREPPQRRRDAPHARPRRGPPQLSQGRWCHTRRALHDHEDPQADDVARSARARASPGWPSEATSRSTSSTARGTRRSRRRRSTSAKRVQCATASATPSRASPSSSTTGPIPSPFGPRLVHGEGRFLAFAEEGWRERAGFEPAVGFNPNARLARTGSSLRRPRLRSGASGWPSTGSRSSSPTRRADGPRS